MGNVSSETLAYSEAPGGRAVGLPNLGGLGGLRATLRMGEAAEHASLTATLPAPAASGVRPAVADDVDEPGLDATQAAPSSDGSDVASMAANLRATRTTVLPRRKRGAGAVSEWQMESRPRFENLEILGRGGMGEVALAKDNDIHRTVAVKRLYGEARTGEAVLRFADEIRAVGQLEHPGIVPVYDVGVDEAGQHYLVMKHVQGQTLEAVIDKLRAGDPETTAQFTFEHRAHIFIEILQAIRFAHDRGFIHRDIKPANIMVGPFGEVTVMDWGLAKKVDRKASAAMSDVSAPGPTGASATGRLLETAHGALLGTPLYMSPEQASGQNDALDERSDVFSLSVLYYELLTLHHPLENAKNLHDVLAKLTAHGLPVRDMIGLGIKLGVPVEHLQYLAPGLAQKREERFQSVKEMEDRLNDIMSGKIRVMCHLSFTKSATHRFLHWVDRHAALWSIIMILTLLGTLSGAVWAVVWAVSAL